MPDRPDSPEGAASHAAARRTPDDLSAARPQARPGVEAHGVLEEMVLYDPERDMAFSLNLSARAVWELCDGERTVTAIVEELSAALDDPPPRLAADVEATVRRLAGLDLLALNASSPDSPDA